MIATASIAKVGTLVGDPAVGGRDPLNRGRGNGPDGDFETTLGEIERNARLRLDARRPG